MEQAASKLTPLQLELLKIYSFNPSQEELQQIKDMLARFFAYRFADNVSKLAEAKGISDATLDQWLAADERKSPFPG
ncbi:MAG: hypothetical protein IPH16_05145 [Haliscomenobacter sp.]|jgi:hypothetical protein|nr:hypothetical protein [Haliscomenobacter sp.]MBK8880533.1 hypothetical protein [Haliscomenobacter sp.]